MRWEKIVQKQTFAIWNYLRLRMFVSDFTTCWSAGIWRSNVGHLSDQVNQVAQLKTCFSSCQIVYMVGKWRLFDKHVDKDNDKDCQTAKYEKAGFWNEWSFINNAANMLKIIEWFRHEIASDHLTKCEGFHSTLHSYVPTGSLIFQTSCLVC